MDLIALNTVEVLLPLAFDHGFDYAEPPGMELKTGDYVRVPFRNKDVVGIVWGPGLGEVEARKIKPVKALLAHLPPMSEDMRRYVDWVASYTLSLRGAVLKMVIPLPDALVPPKEEPLYQLTGLEPKLTAPRLRVISFLKGQPPLPFGIIAERTHATPAIIRGLLAAGALKAVSSAPRSLPVLTPDINEVSIAFTDAQRKAIETLRKNREGFKPTLLDGVTGSGKTEVYFELVADTIRSGKQALVLLPEIALSVQWLSRFARRFGFEPGLWHSDVSRAKKRNLWQSVTLGETKVVVGARSALFLPYRDLGLIVIDEEHDHSFKQEEGVIYQARDMAVVRAKEEDIPIILVSATPSLETTVNAEQKRYGYVHLPERVGEAEMPIIKLVDMREEKLPARLFLSHVLKAKLANTVATGGQAMLFLNRRGYAPLVLCNHCGHRFQCPECTTWLVLHRARKGPERLICHHCNFTMALPRLCPSCAKEDSFRACGPGVERIAEEVREFLPQARLGVLSSDEAETGDETRKLTPQQQLVKIITDMEQGQIDILIGTQMIAKGHHFAQLSLVGVIDADMSLSGGDLRAGERTYQLLHQLSGRAGREKRKGEVLIQSYMPEHPVMQALLSGERDMFMTIEAQMRKDAQMPPFGRLAAIVVEGASEAATRDAAQAMARAIPQGNTLKATATGEVAHYASSPLVLGPAPAPLFKLRGKTRYRFLIKSPRQFPLQSYLREWLASVDVPRNMRVKVDVDPYSFL